MSLMLFVLFGVVSVILVLWLWIAVGLFHCFFFFFSSRRRHTRCLSDWSSDVCSSDLPATRSDRRQPRRHLQGNAAGRCSERGCGPGPLAAQRGRLGGKRSDPVRSLRGALAARVSRH